MSKTPLKSSQWFTHPPKKSHANAIVMQWVRPLIGFGVAGLLYWLGWHAMAYIAGGLTALFALIGIVSSATHKKVEGAFVRFGLKFSQGLTWLVLVPLYFTGFAGVRLFDRLAGRDPLSLRLQPDAPSYWTPSDTDARKVRWFGASFATERPAQIAGRRFLPLVVLGIVLLVGGELILRAMGYGTPVLYADSTEIGYLPAPSQSVTRQGHHIEINRYGMRSPEFVMPKPKGTFRILMLGDSTLYGGSYVDQSELYSTHVQAQLAALRPSGQVEVLAMGVNGWGPFHELGYVRANGTFDADLAIVALPFGDVRRPLSRLGNTPYLPVNAPPSLAYEEVLYHLSWRWRRGKIGAPNAEELKSRYEKGYLAYAALATLLKKTVPEVVFEVLPSATAGMGQSASPREQRVVDGLKAALPGFSLGYPVGLFAEKPSDLELYHDWVHLHRDGHRIYAQYLTQRIAAVSRGWAAYNREAAP